MARKPLPRHVIGAISVAIGFFGGIALLLILPQKFGVSPKLTGFIALGVWIASTWVFWTGGKEKPAAKDETPPPQAG
ncbi:hypothetical protein CU669_07930 [Paramagnetospirillum kuznetsovii]|uniref:Uncharacterized protein n=1 Tax=Paramagnetospirillum kuznetsovii TaxID=2053833 RepID=A0A364NZT8_9PROT|nr:hypothetical protein [Paramagnetospirillum kuznetsovii]RAU22601.1 hypothetical protein CU669_07930 [Paramagnetospirillum kuznetsovii]